MQPDFSITPATLDDLTQIIPMFDAYRVFYRSQSDPESAKKFLTERIARQESKIFWAWRQTPKERQPMGFTQLYPSFSSVSMQRLWILNDLYVNPEFRVSGVGAALMQAARVFAQNDGAKGLSLATQIQNLTAQSLYLKQGYRKDEQFYHYHLVF